MDAPLTTTDVRTFLMDSPDQNFLLDAQEFSDPYITLCMGLAISSFNAITPVSSYTDTNFPNRMVWLYGTCWQMFAGRAALAARNQLSYSDGGLQIPVEEKYELYAGLSASFGAQFKEMAQRMKIQDNIDNGWSSVGGDESFFPTW